MNVKSKDKKVSLVNDEINNEQNLKPVSIEQYQNDVVYQYMIDQLNELLENKLISKEEFHQIELELRHELKPYLYELYPL